MSTHLCSAPFHAVQFCFTCIIIYSFFLNLPHSFLQVAMKQLAFSNYPVFIFHFLVKRTYINFEQWPIGYLTYLSKSTFISVLFFESL